MSRDADVLVVLVPEVEDHEETAAALLGEAGRVAEALGGRVAGVELGGEDAADVEASVRALSHHVRVRSPRIVLMLDGDLSRELAPRLALSLSSLAIVGATGVSVTGKATAYSKPVFGGWLEQELAYAPGSLEVVTLVGSALSAPPAAAELSNVTGVSQGEDVATRRGLPITRLEVRRTTGEPAVRRLGLTPPDYRTVDIVHAKRIVAAGMGAAGRTPATAATAGGTEPFQAPVGAVPAGVAEETPAGVELLDYVSKLAELLAGSVAATRPMVDEGRLPKERLVGQTGKTVAPELYLALGISGSPHHVAGIQGAGTIIAVDRDPAAPIFDFSDAGYVADLREILPALIRRIEHWRDGGD